MDIPACPKTLILTDQSALGTVHFFKYLFKIDGIMFLGHRAVFLSGKSQEEGIISTVLSSINSTIE